MVCVPEDNPLTPKSDYLVASPYDLHSLFSNQVMSILKPI